MTVRTNSEANPPTNANSTRTSLFASEVSPVVSQEGIDENEPVVRRRSESKERLHDYCGRDLNLDPLQSVLDHQAGRDLVDGEGLERVLKRRDPLWSGSIRLLVIRGESGNDAPEASEERRECLRG